MGNETFAAMKERTGAATNRIAAKAYQSTVTDRATALEAKASASLVDRAPVAFGPGATLRETLGNALDALMQGRDLGQAAQLLRDNPGFGIQLFHQASVNRTRPEFEEVVGRIADLHTEYMKSPDLAAADGFSNFDWIENRPGPPSNLREQALDGYFFPTVGGLVARLTPSAAENLVMQDRFRPLQEGLLAFSVENGQVRSLGDGDFDARAVHAADPIFLGRALEIADARAGDVVAGILLRDQDPALLQRFKDVLRLGRDPMSLETQFGPVLAAVEGVARTRDIIAALGRWGAEARLSVAHIAELREDMTQRGLGRADEDFAKYLFCLSAIFTKISGDKGFGANTFAVVPLRYYGFMLMKASEETAPVLSGQEIYGFIDRRFNVREDGFQDEFTADRCADMLGNKLIQTAVTIDRTMFEKVASQPFVDVSRNVAGFRPPLEFPVARAGAGAENDGGLVRVLEAQNRDDGIAMLRRLTEVDSDDSSIRDIDDIMNDDSDAGEDEGAEQVEFREFIMRQIMAMDRRA